MSKTETNIDYEVMIVGGGPAGISTWLHLHKYAPELASKSVLIEKEKYPRDKLCGGAVGGWSDLVLKQLDVSIDTPSIYVNTIECRFKDDLIQINEPNLFRIVQRQEFDYAFAKCALKRGLQLNEGEKLLNFVRKKNHLLIKTNIRNYKVRILVGADGAISKVRQKMNIDNNSLAPAIEIFEPVNPKYDREFEEKKAVFDFSAIEEGLQGYVWHFPCLKNDRAYMNHGIGDFRINKKRPKANMKNLFIRELRKRNIHREMDSWSGHPIRWLSNFESVAQPNVLLIGDAAGIDPATGGGIHLALSYGELAAKSIIDAHQTNDFSFSNYIKLLKSHLVGRYIQKLTNIANEMYNQKIDPLKSVEKIFSKKL